MSPRVTRSAAKKSAESSLSPQDPPDPPSAPPPASLKRKIPTSPAQQEDPQPSDSTPSSSRRNAKRSRVSAAEPRPEAPAPALARSSTRRKESTTMTGSVRSTAQKLGQLCLPCVSPPPDQSPESLPSPPAQASSSASRRRSSNRGKKAPIPSGLSSRRLSLRSASKPSEDADAASPPQSSKRSKASASKKRSSSSKKELPSKPEDPAATTTQQETNVGGSAEDPTPEHDEDDDMDEDDPFGSAAAGLLAGGRGGPFGMSALRALSGMVSGMGSRMRGFLEQLRQKDDPTAQYLALQELSEILLISTEDNLAGHLSPDAFSKEFISLMGPNIFGDDNAEMQLIACRCLANLIEAMPAATASVVYNGAVPVLIGKLKDIQYMDLAEQALITLEKISGEFPAAIASEGGLKACLEYLDFFATGVQRTAVTTAANCARNIPEEAFNSITDIMPILLNVLNSSDQRVVEQGCLCVSRIVESFKYQDDKLEELMSADLLRAILRLLLPGATNLIGPAIHTQFLRVLAITARASPSLSAELFKMNVVDTLYQVLTGVSPPSGVENVAQNIDSVVIMQALIHRPRDQVFETLNVVCELLPGLDRSAISYLLELHEHSTSGERSTTESAAEAIQSRKDSLHSCRAELRRFAIVLFPTLTDAYSSTVNLSVRQKVLLAQLRMLSNLGTDILQDALRPVPYASFLASILSQQDHPALITFALQAAELLLQRLEPIYRYQFYREGVIAEVKKLAARPIASTKTELPETPEKARAEPVTEQQEPRAAEAAAVAAIEEPRDAESVEDPKDEDNDEDEDGMDIAFVDEDHEEDSEDEDSDGDTRPSDADPASYQATLQQHITTKVARSFIERHDNDAGRQMLGKATKILDDLQQLVADIADAYYTARTDDGLTLFRELAQHFEGDALESITSYELLSSKIIGTLLDVFQDNDVDVSRQARAAFTQVFMGSPVKSSIRTASSDSPVTPFSVLVQKLQDLLSRAEHFEVVTVNQNAFESNRSNAASMLAKQIRIRLVADETSGIPATFRNIMVSIHAIANFKSLDEYLRPRIVMTERPRRQRDASEAAAMYERMIAEAAGGRAGLPFGYPPPDALLAGRSPNPASRAEASSRPSSSRSGTKKSSAKAKAPASPPADARQAPDSEHAASSSSRRSTRRATRESALASPTERPQETAAESGDAPLECADETGIENDGGLDSESAMDALVDEFEEELETQERPDPSAVSMEVGSSGKVTARDEDGARIGTPAQSQTTTPTRLAPPGRSSSTLARSLLASLPSRSMSYAAAAQAMPTDWHLEFSVNGQPISSSTTIYRAVHNSQPADADRHGRSTWNAIHTINLKRVPGPAPPETGIISNASEPSAISGLPQSLDKNPITARILRLLHILHDMNSNLDDVLSENRLAAKVNTEPLSAFVNTKLTAKLNRQLEEPLIVASNTLPSWSEDLARLYPFLFPFESRHLFLQSTSFGYSRSMTRWQNAQSSSDSRRLSERPYLGRLQRQKVRISRVKLLESAIKVMELYGASPSTLEVEYFEEVGTGLGPTLEFYSNVSKEFSKKKLRLWRENEAADSDVYAFAKRGLYPAPMSEAQLSDDNGQKVLTLFKMLGKFVARSMIDSRIIDISFNPAFFRASFDADEPLPPLGAVKAIDEGLASSLQTLKQLANAKKKIEEKAGLSPAQKAQKISRIQIGDVSVDDMGLDFTLPGYSNIDLIPNGSDTPVTIDNVGLYVDKVVDFTLRRGVQKQIEAFRSGFSQVFPYTALRAFTPDELVMLFGRVNEDWSLETLTDSIKADHGYNMDSHSVRNLLQLMSEFEPAARRDFLQFVTGSPKLPIGGTCPLPSRYLTADTNMTV